MGNSPLTVYTGSVHSRTSAPEEKLIKNREGEGEGEGGGRAEGGRGKETNQEKMQNKENMISFIT